MHAISIYQVPLETHIVKTRDLRCGGQANKFRVMNYLEMCFEADGLINCRLVLIVMDGLNNNRTLDNT